MASYSISAEDFEDAELKGVYTYVKSRLNFSSDDLDMIFEIALMHKDRFPAINLNGAFTLEKYIERWINGYAKAKDNIPSKRIARPKSSCTDPSLKTVVKAVLGLSEEEAVSGETYHNLFMSAENILGNLLEEYIAPKVKPYGFLWCEGNVLSAIDFCNSDGTFFLQIKNKSNSENSSSNKIREHTDIHIEKWYRLGTRSEKNKKVPTYKWEVLNKFINDHKTMGIELAPCCMTEDEYQEFLQRKASENHSLITNQ